MTPVSISSLFDDVEDLMEDDDEVVYDTSVSIRGKWILDGAQDLAEAAEMARAYADYLDNLQEEGYVLRNPIEDDYGFATID